MYLPIHRTVTHSVGAVALTMIIAAAVTGWVTRRVKVKVGTRLKYLGVAVICAAAYGSHLLLDWLGADRKAAYGIQALWPFSHAMVHFAVDDLSEDRAAKLLLTSTDVRDQRERVAVVGSRFRGRCSAASVQAYVKTVTRFSTEVARRHHPLEQRARAVLGSPRPSCNTLRIARQTSSPMKSASLSGPIG